jgi:Zn-dependent alcohol dehydrogenase
MISRRGELEEINDMFDSMKKGEVARQIIVFE